MVNGVKLGVVAICAVLFGGCSNEPAATFDSVAIITYSQARQCRVVDTFNVENQSSPEVDIERGAMARAQALAVEKGGDAILIQSNSVTPSRASGDPAVMAIKGQILACPRNTARDG